MEQDEIEETKHDLDMSVSFIEPEHELGKLMKKSKAPLIASSKTKREVF